MGLCWDEWEVYVFLIIVMIDVVLLWVIGIV